MRRLGIPTGLSTRGLASRHRGRFAVSPGGSEEATFGLSSDVAANVFVVLFVALVVGLMLRPAPPPTADFELSGARGLIERAPNDAAAAIAALHRRQAGKGVALDLFADRLRLATPGVERQWPWTRAGEIREALREIPGGGAIDLFVFDPAGYPLVVDALRGRSVDEFSVPLALRSCAARGGCADDWTDGFRRLIGRDLGPADFRAALARLLSARSEARDGSPARDVGGAEDAAMRRDASPAEGSAGDRRIGFAAVLLALIAAEMLAFRQWRRR